MSSSSINLAPIILGIESSCDETAAAVVRGGEEILASVVLSQFATHQPFGGVVPELASREHLRALVPVVRRALEEAGQNYASLDAIAVTQGPGLAGALLVGVSFAKALAYAEDKPLIAVNHLEGHIHAVLLEQKQQARAAGNTTALRFPLLALVVSGGHTHLYLAHAADEAGSGGWTYQNVGHTRDDAAGEAFDKVAKLLGLGYPGGPLIDGLAAHGDDRAVKFAFAQLKHPDRNPQGARKYAAAVSSSPASQPGARTTMPPRVDFSYSGIKTAVLRHVETHAMLASIEARRKALAGIAKVTVSEVLPLCDAHTLDLIASFQRAMVEDLVRKTLAAAEACGAKMLFVTGGVAANSALRGHFNAKATALGLPVFFPSRPLSTDNAAMIAAAAYPKFLANLFAPADFSAEASLALR